MDGQRFDLLSRRFAKLGSRRQALKTIAGAMVATLAGSRSVSAQDCVQPYSPCQGDDQCCAGTVCEWGMCQRGCRIESAFVHPGSSPPANPCVACDPSTSTTSGAPAREGLSCWSGDLCAGPSMCQAGVCTGTNPVECVSLGPCHLAGECNPATGLCSNPPAEAGTPCGNGAMCHGEVYQPADVCDGNGFCIGGGARSAPCAPFRCGQDACTTTCAQDDDCASGAHCDDGQCITDLGLGEPCDEDDDCRSGLCVGGICCNQRCEGLCESCSAETEGHCRPIICDDGLACTTGRCNEETGECLHTINSGTCLIDGACYTTSAVDPNNACQRCDPETSQSEWSFAPAGTVCADTSACDEGTITNDALCDASGVCGAATTTSCLPYACTEQLTCLTSCSVNAECAGGATCCDTACITGECCTPLTCETNGGACGTGLDDGCGDTIDCECPGCPSFQTELADGSCVNPCSLGTCGSCGRALCGALANGTAVCLDGNPLVSCSETCTTTPPGQDACLQVWDVPNLSPWCGATSGAAVDFQGGFSLPVCYAGAP